MKKILKKIFLAIILGFCTFSLAQTIQVLNIPDTYPVTANSRNTTYSYTYDGTNYTVSQIGFHLNGNTTYYQSGSTIVNGAKMVDAKAKLTNPANFGAAGTVPHAINIVDGFATRGSITSVAALNNYDIIYIGFYYRGSGSAFTAAELNYLLEWSKQPGKVLMVQEQAVHSPVSTTMGYSIIDGSNTNPTRAVSNDNVMGINMFSGVFGTVSSTGINQTGFSQGYFSGDCVGIPISKNVSDKSTIIFNTEYRDVLVADTGFFTELVNPSETNMSSGSGIVTNADKAWANLWAWAVEEVVNKVSPGTPTITGEVYTNQTLPLCNGDAAVLSLRNYNAPILRWQTSTDGGTTWTNIASTNSTIVYPNPQNNQRFRVVLGNIPECPEIYSPSLTITTQVCATGCNVQTAQMAAYNNQTNTSQIFANNVIGIGSSRMSVSHIAHGGWTITPNRISDTHFAGEFGINLGHNTTATSYATRLETTINFSAPVKDLKFTINDVDHSERFRIYAYDSNNNLLSFGTSNFDLYFGSVVSYNPGVGTTGEFQAPSTMVDNNTRFGTIDFKFNGVSVSRIVIEFYDTLYEGSFTITKFSGVSEQDCPPFDCTGKTYSLSATTGEIRAFNNPNTSGALGAVINTTPHPAVWTGTNGPNALGYSNATGKFYYVQVQGTSSVNNVFVSYDPNTNTYETLAGTTGLIYRGTVTNNGMGYYAITSTNVLKYYNISNNTWTTVASNYVDQNGVSLNALLNEYAGGDIAMDGNGDLWILAGGKTGSPTAYIFRVKSAVPTTNTGATPLVLEQIVKQDIGLNPNGISFNSAGELLFSNASTLFRMNRDFSISTIGTISPTGAQGDLASCAYPLNPFANSDFGDAPDTFGTLLASNGPRHTASKFDATNNTAALMIGTKIDLESDGIPNADANGDDNNNINDENSTTFTVLNSTATTYTVTVPVTNTTGASATLKGWIDFNKNGIFDASEGVTATVANNATSAVLSWTGLSGLSTGDTYYRLRIANNATSVANPTGEAFGGEVEDGKIVIVAPPVCYEDAGGTASDSVPVKHGITVLGRAGKENGNWPMLRNSAYTVLESKTKGFVITRIASPETAIAEPKVGMMVFDTDADAGKGCLKINTDGTSTGWKCFNKQTCP